MDSEVKREEFVEEVVVAREGDEVIVAKAEIDVTVEREVEVRVKSLVTGEATTFLMPIEATLDQAWAKAYKKLDESKRDGDSFQCAKPEEGKSLMNDLTLTLAEARKQRICGSEACHYEIKGPSGGASCWR